MDIVKQDTPDGLMGENNHEEIKTNDSLPEKQAINSIKLDKNEVHGNNMNNSNDFGIKEIIINLKTKYLNMETFSENTEQTNDNLITKEMIEEENKLEKDREKEMEECRERGIKKVQDITSEMRLNQLRRLLTKSNVYANYLLKNIEKSKKKEKKKEALRRKKRESLAANPILSENVALKRSQKRSFDVDSCENISNAPKKLKQEHDKENAVGEQKVKGNLQEFQIGDKVQIIRKDSYGDEELVDAKIVEVSLQEKDWNYKVSFAGRNKSRDEWIERKDIVVDNKEEGDSDSSDEEENKAQKLQKQASKLDKEALLKEKVYSGDLNKNRMVTVDGIRYLDSKRVADNQPKYLTGAVLRDYQLKGYSWLKVLFDNAINGILADEMGLGKTIQSIAMICKLIVGRAFRGPFLVCAPLSTICNWMSEFKRFAPMIPLLLYHGSASERLVLSSQIRVVNQNLGCFPVVITSNEIVIRDEQLLAKHKWDYLILDEAHRIKNMNCRLIRALKSLKVHAKVLLTGTPLQNSLAELWSLLNFLLPELFNDLTSFETWFDLDKIQKGISTDKEKDVVFMMHKILTPFLLRRTKDDIEIELPPKRELLVFARLTNSQRDFHEALVNKSILKLLKVDKAGEEINDEDQKFATYERETRSSTLKSRLEENRRKSRDVNDDAVVNISLSNVMMQLRKCCNHPYLIQYPLIPGTDMYRVDQEVISSSGKMELLDKMLSKLKEHNHKVLLFSQMTKLLDILGDYCRLKNYTHVRLDGSTSCVERQKHIDQYNGDPDLFIFLLSTKAGGLGINLTAADTVIIFDSDWNPQNDLQAQDRCHRIGQTRPVVIYRLVTANTVDQFMVERAEAKRVLERLIINKSKFKGKLEEDMKSENSQMSFSSQILSMLQKSKEEDGDTAGGILSDKELNKLLDRKYVMTCDAKDIKSVMFRTLE